MKTGCRSDPVTPISCRMWSKGEEQGKKPKARQACGGSPAVRSLIGSLKAPDAGADTLPTSAIRQAHDQLLEMDISVEDV